MAKFVKDHSVAIAAVAGASACAVACPFALPLVVNGIGFGSGGIVAGTWASGFMSSYGGAVAANSPCALLQSVGAAGLGAQGIAAATAVGATVGGATSAVLAKVGGLFFKKNPGAGKSAGAEEKTAEAQENKNDDPEADEDGLAKPCEAGEKAQENQNDEALAKACEVGEEAEEAEESQKDEGGLAKPCQTLIKTGPATCEVEKDQMKAGEEAVETQEAVQT